MDLPDDLHDEALRDNAAAITYRFRVGLERAHPDRFVLQSHLEVFHVESYARAGHCEIEPSGPHSEIDTQWSGRKKASVDVLRNGAFEVRWQGHGLRVEVLTKQGPSCEKSVHFIVAESEEVARSFFEAVARWSHEVRGEVLVFQDAHWSKSADLYHSIAGATFDEIVLAGDLKEQIAADFEQFIGARDRYESHGVPWKRGVLLTGPPGNGKTLCVKAIVNLLGVPCLYVKSFETRWDTPQACIHRAFSRARDTTPCVMVLEDLDSLISDESRAFFLNELDGFAHNTGIVCVATTNHPDKLDPAILDRPSRFDMKYHFDLPAAPERAAYVALWNRKLNDELRLDDDRALQVVEQTEGFSFAYLKELYLSALMRWASERGDFGALVTAQIAPLRAQLGAAGHVVAADADEPA